MSDQIDVNQLSNAIQQKVDLPSGKSQADIDYVVGWQAPTSSDPTWYRLYKSGWVEQGGKISASSNSISYPIKMADDTYTLIVSATSSGTVETRHSMPITSERTVSSVTVYIGQYNGAGTTSSAYVHNWEVKGFAAQS